MKIHKLITVNPKMDFTIEYTNTFGNKEAFTIPTNGIKIELIPISEDLQEKIKFYKFQGAIKQIEEVLEETKVSKGINPFEIQAQKKPETKPELKVQETVQETQQNSSESTKEDKKKFEVKK